MPRTRKLLSITNLKKYFPVAKTSVFQKNQLYVRANEDISLDIYEGETIGVVGESGCGKSTLGRVLLQLYPQTAGNTMYYGTTLAEMAPQYVEDTLRHVEKYRAKYKKAREKAQELNKKVEQIGEENADFYLLQDRNLARCEEQTCLNNLVKILGGFFAADENGQGCALILKVHQAGAQRARLAARRADIAVEYDFQKSAEKPKGLDKLQQKLDRMDQLLAAKDKDIAALNAELNALRAKYADNAEFAKYEAMRDDGIDLARLKYKEQRGLRKDLQIIFQDPYSSLNPRFTIGQII